MEKAVVGLALLVLFCLVVPGESQGFLGDLKNTINKATDIANSLGTSGEGKIDRGEGCTISWSFKGMLMGIKWKYMGTCTDSCAKQTSVVFTNSKAGAVENCIEKLMAKISP